MDKRKPANADGLTHLHINPNQPEAAELQQLAGEMRAWKGTARGDLSKGKLEGEATEDRDRERTFVFKGKTKDGVFAGEHGAIRDGEMNNLGTITLERAGS